MRERMRRAIDVAGHRVELLERRDFAFSEANQAAIETDTARMLFTPDGQPLIDDGDDFFRNPFGTLYKLID